MVPILLVKKPGKSLCFYVDYCALNAVTIKNWYLIPLINKTLGKLANAVRFTKLNIIATFNRMRMKEGQEWMIAFNTRHGQFEYLVMLFDLCNAPETFQSYINNSLHEYLDVFCIAYLDNILVYSTKKEKHTRHVLDMLKWLRDRELQVDINKCKFFVTQVKYLGLIISINGISIDFEKVQTILDWETLTLVKNVQVFLGFSNFYQQFVEKFSQHTRLLTKLTKGEQYSTKFGKKRVKYHLFEWIEACQKTFEDLKHAFTTVSVLAHYDARLET